jgi:hypothetical protein
MQASPIDYGVAGDALAVSTGNPALAHSVKPPVKFITFE